MVKIDIQRIILQDILTKYDLTASEEILDQLNHYLSLRGKKILAIDTNSNLIVSSSITSTTNLKENINTIGPTVVTSYIQKDSDFDIVENSEDIFEASSKNQIPLSRLTYDYESLFDLNPIYLNKLDKIYFQIYDEIQFLLLHNFLTRVIKEKNLADFVREFLNKELQQA